MSEVPDGFKLSKSMRAELPESQRGIAEEELWRKAGGLCALCDEPLPPDGRGVVPDHKIAVAEGAGGPTTIENLYLAHADCNNRRKNLPFELAQRVVKFFK